MAVNNSEGREHVRGAEENIFDLFARASTPGAWAQWLGAPLELAAAQGDRVLALQLVAAGAVFGTAVHAAILGAHAGLATDLLENGALSSATDSDGRTPLHVAADVNMPAVVRTLLGPPPSGSHDDQAAAAAAAATADVMNTLTYNGLSPMYIAASKGSVESLRLMIDHGGVSMDTPNADGRTALHGAAREGKLEAIEMLVQAGASIEVVADRHGGTPLDDAASNVNRAGITTLLKHGAAVEGSDQDPSSPLLRLGQSGRPTMAALLPLIRGGADVKARDVDDDTILHELCYRANAIPDVVEMVELVLRMGADETATSYGFTPLGRLLENNPAEAECVKCVRQLLENAPADRAWRRRGLMVLCRAFPGRVRLNLPPGTDGVADSGTHDAFSATQEHEPLSSRRRRVDVAAVGSDGAGGSSVGSSSSGSGGGSGIERAESDSGSDLGEGRGWSSVLAAWVLGTGEEAIFRNIVLYL
eukprot:g13143.t1